MLTLSIQPIVTLHAIRAPLKGVTQIIIIFVIDGLINLLILYVFANLRFVQANCTDIIATRSKAVALKISFQSTVFLEYNHGALALEVSHNG